MKRLLSLLLSVVVLSSFLSLALPTTPALAQSTAWCGNGSAPDYGFSDPAHFYDLKQPYWLVGNNLVKIETQQAVETILNKLNDDQLAQTMILVLPTNQVGDSVNCAVHFLRYEKLGVVGGPHDANGFVWLIMVNSDDSLAEVHYGVGLGLNALTAPGLGDLKRVATDNYDSTKSVDAAILALVKGYDEYVRTQYPVETQSVATSSQSPVVVQPVQPTASNNSGPDPLIVLMFILVGGLILFGGGYWLLKAMGVIGSDEAAPVFDNSDTSSVSSSYTPSDYTPVEEHHHHEEPAPEPTYHPSYTPPAYHPSYTPPPTPHFNPPSTPFHSGGGSGQSGRGG